jgi:hypothetical protein
MLTGSQEPIFTRSRSVVSRVVAGETLIVPVRGKVGDLASIYSFNSTGSLIWQLLDAPRSLNDLISAVASEYEVGQEQAHGDVMRFVEEMLSVGLVDVCPLVAMAEAEMTSMDMTADMTATESNRQAALESAGSH